jgi:hypothetical protein
VTKKKNPDDPILAELAVLKTDIEWLKKEQGETKSMIARLEGRIWALLAGVVLAVISSIIGALIA